MVLTEDWIPHIPVTAEGSSVYASQFSTGTTRLWLLVNRGLEDKDQELRLPCGSASASWFDLYHGALMEEVICNEEEGVSFLARIKIEAGGIGAVLLTEDTTFPGLADLLLIMNEMTQIPLQSFSAETVFAMQTMEDLTPDIYTDRKFSQKSTSILVPGGRLNFTVTGNAIECYDPACPVDVQYPWEDRPTRWHSSWVDVPNLYVDQHLVTDAEFNNFMSDSGWKPVDDMNFLRHWSEIDDPSTSQRPVNWVSAWDAAAYCAWQGARLPHSWEWQWFAQVRFLQLCFHNHCPFVRATQALAGHGAMILMTARCLPSRATRSSPWPSLWEGSLKPHLGPALRILLDPFISGLTSSQMSIHQGIFFFVIMDASR